MAGMSGPVGGAGGPEDVGDRERGAQAASAARIPAVFVRVVSIATLHQQRQTLEWAGHRADRLGCDLGIERGRIELAMPQQS